MSTPEPCFPYFQCGDIVSSFKSSSLSAGKIHVSQVMHSMQLIMYGLHVIVL